MPAFSVAQAERHPKPRQLNRDFWRRFRNDEAYRRWLILNVSTVIEIAVGLSIFALFVPRFQGDILLFVFLLALNLIAERVPILVYRDSILTVGFVFTLPIMAIFGVPGVAIAAPLETVVRRLGLMPISMKLPRNACRGVTVYSLSAVVYSFIAPLNPERISYEMIGGLAASLVTFALTALLISWIKSLESGRSFATIWSNNAWVGVHYLAFGVVGVSLLASYIGLGYWGVVAFLVPAFMLRVSMKQYVDKTSENVERLEQQNKALETANIEIRKFSDELRITYNATLEALVSALEARDQETKGHSVRVARYMINIAEALGVERGTQQWLDMQHGALLHDVGKIGVRDSILLKPGKLTDREWEYMRKHPQISYNILSEAFSQSAARSSSRTMNVGTAMAIPGPGERISHSGRESLWSSMFDTMTSDRVYRKTLTTQDALNEILRCSGTQFDPLVVEAFLDIYDAWVIERERMRDSVVSLAPPLAHD
jgi:hypothetical protein